MAKLKPLFGAAQVRKAFDNLAEEYDKKMISTLQFIGEQFVNDARIKGNYTDRTGNLRSSIGYVVLKDGQVVRNNFQGKPSGVAKAREYAISLAAEYSEGFVLIGVAGMEYAAYVEAKNFDVISGSAPTKEILTSIFNGINF